MPTVKVDACQCNQCGHIWLSRNRDEKPVACASCKSPYWDRPKKK